MSSNEEELTFLWRTPQTLGSVDVRAISCFKWGDIPADRLTPEGLEWLRAILVEHEDCPLAHIRSTTRDCLCPEEDGEHDDDCPFAHPIVGVRLELWVRPERDDAEELIFMVEGKA